MNTKGETPMQATSSEQPQTQYAFRRPRYFTRTPPSLEHATVGDAAQSPLLIFPASSSLRAVAQSMAANRVHSVIVRDAPNGVDGWGLVTDAVLVDALAAGRLDASAGDVASAPVVTARLDQPLLDAVRLMQKGRATHMLVVDPDSRQPLGVLSGLDLAATWAWGLG